MIVSDWTFWRARCDLAAQLNTDVGTLECLVWARILSDAGLWDPKTPKDLPTKVLVTLRDLQDAVKANKFGVNPALQGYLLKDSGDAPPSSDPFEDDFNDR